MDKDYRREFDELRTQVAELQEAVRALLLIRPCDVPSGDVPQEQESPEGEQNGEVKKMVRPHASQIAKLQENVHGLSQFRDPNVAALLDSLEDEVELRGVTGAITYMGTYVSGERHSIWVRKNVHTDGLLRLIEDHSAERVLACIGNNDRLNLLLTLMRRPMTVAQLVEKCGYHSTGQVYHHLRPLIAANLVAEDEYGDVKGRYLVVAHRVQGIMMLLAGISDMLDPQYTQGEWEESCDRAARSGEIEELAEEKY